MIISIATVLTLTCVHLIGGLLIMVLMIISIGTNLLFKEVIKTKNSKLSPVAQNLKTTSLQFSLENEDF